MAPMAILWVAAMFRPPSSFSQTYADEGVFWRCAGFADSAVKVARDREGISTTSRSTAWFTHPREEMRCSPRKPMRDFYFALRFIYRLLNHFLPARARTP
jgi:hypothetical protein